MGILDDAIRQHLELKRSLGADDDELKQLEDEAFGPPARPGDPDFPEPDLGDSGAEEASNGAPPPEPAGSDATQEPPAEPAPTEPGEPPPAEPAEALEDPGEPTDEPGGPALFDQAVDEPEPSEPEPSDVPAASTETPPEPAADAPAPPPEEALEADSGSELDLGELDLEIEEAELPPLDPDPPIESLETVEHKVEPGPGEEEELAVEDDVLADTPEFLRDAPEDDDLWFEQGEPKDFDFDE